MADAFRITIEKVTGFAPPTCPWRAFEEQIVVDVDKAHGWFESGQVALRLGSDDPPYYMIEGVERFERALNACEYDRRKRENQKREALRNAQQAAGAVKRKR